MNTLRTDLIKAALTGAMANPNNQRHGPEDFAELAIKTADATLAKLNAESPITGSAEVDWSQAPEWAMWHAWDDNGRGYWYERPAKWMGSVWNNNDEMVFNSDLPKPANLAARDSLTRRPGK
jgi:hypothetical protein